MHRLAPLVPLALLAGLAACGGESEAAEIARIRAGTDAVRARLTDPASAQFRNVAAHGDAGGAVCGEVNASVGMGRTGYERFVVKDGKVTLGSDLSSDAAMDARWAADCK